MKITHVLTFFFLRKIEMKKKKNSFEIDCMGVSSHPSSCSINIADFLPKEICERELFQHISIVVGLMDGVLPFLKRLQIDRCSTYLHSFDSFRFLLYPFWCEVQVGRFAVLLRAKSSRMNSNAYTDSEGVSLYWYFPLRIIKALFWLLKA